MKTGVLVSVIMMLGLSFWDAGGAAGADKTIFEFDVVDTQRIWGEFSVLPDREITVDWGDGSSDTFAGRATYQKDYGEKVDVKVKIRAGGEADLAGFSMWQAGANIKFEIKDLPGGLKDLSVSGSNTVRGDISDMPRGMVGVVLSGANTVSGDISGLPSGLEVLRITGRSTLTGDISALPEGLSVFEVSWGLNTVSGNVAGLPSGLTVFIAYGRNSVSGRLGDLPPGLEDFQVAGTNTLTGVLADLPAGLKVFNIGGLNTVRGSIDDLPAGLVSFGGSVSRARGARDTFGGGDLADLPAGIRSFSYEGNELVFRYTPGRNWAQEMRNIVLKTSGEIHAMDTVDFDNLLIDLSGTTWTGAGRIIVNARRSSASDGALSALEEKGVAVEMP